MKTCTVDGCERKHECKGLCHTHYMQTRTRKPNPTATYPCTACGTDTVKDAGRDKKYASLYCSDLCKNYDRYGGCSSRLPGDHWARWYGRTSAWSPRTYAVDCAWCGTRKVASSSLVKYCTRECKKRHARVIRRGKERDAAGDYTWMDVTRLWQAFDRACAYCATPTPLADIQAEHVVALSNGGANNTTNLLPSCAACNSDKRDLPLHEWNKDRERRGLEPRRTTWSANDSRYRHLTSVHALAA